jgi:hypothetical protein
MAATPISHDDEDDTGSAWGFLWVLFAFKVVTVALIFWHLRTVQSGILIGATTWYWFPVFGIMLAGPLLFRYRLRRVRARREALRRAEWMLAPGQDVDETTLLHR